MYSEKNRLKTFKKWKVEFIDQNKLALYGFYSIDPESDAVKCYFCGVEIGQWELGDTVLREHIRWSPLCPLLRREKTDNIPINIILLEKSLPPHSFDVYPNHTYLHQQQQEELLDYSLQADRLKSFTSYPSQGKPSPFELSEAGFFHLNNNNNENNDHVRCFSCGGGLTDWRENDIAWEQHAIWYPKCHYLNLIKGLEFVQQIQQQHQQHQQLQQYNQHEPQTNRKIILNHGHDFADDVVDDDDDDYNGDGDSNICKICLEKHINIILIPCMHVVICYTCSQKLHKANNDKCPVCRSQIFSYNKIYFS